LPPGNTVYGAYGLQNQTENGRRAHFLLRSMWLGCCVLERCSPSAAHQLPRTTGVHAYGVRGEIGVLGAHDFMDEYNGYVVSGLTDAVRCRVTMEN